LFFFALAFSLSLLNLFITQTRHRPSRLDKVRAANGVHDGGCPSLPSIESFPIAAAFLLLGRKFTGFRRLDSESIAGSPGVGVPPLARSDGAPKSLATSVPHSLSIGVSAPPTLKPFIVGRDGVSAGVTKPEAYDGDADRVVLALAPIRARIAASVAWSFSSDSMSSSNSKSKSKSGSGSGSGSRAGG